MDSALRCVSCLRPVSRNRLLGLERSRVHHALELHLSREYRTAAGYRTLPECCCEPFRCRKQKPGPAHRAPREGAGADPGLTRWRMGDADEKLDREVRTVGPHARQGGSQSRPRGAGRGVARPRDRRTRRRARETMGSWGRRPRPARGAGPLRRIGGDCRRREEVPVTGAERAAHGAAMTENMLRRTVLDDPRAAGSNPRSISGKRRVELGERLRAATGLPLREIARFLGISRSSYAYHRARLGCDRYAGLRGRGPRPARGDGRQRLAAESPRSCMMRLTTFSETRALRLLSSVWTGR